MKPLIPVLAALAVLITLGCVTRHSGAPSNSSAMLIDSSYGTDKSVTVLRTNAPVRIIETMKNFEDNPNIMQADIDAGKKIETYEVRYVNKGERIRISEVAPPTRK
jgi:hypothetical protein